MRNLLLGLVCASSLLGGTAQAATNDIIELGVGIRYLFDSGFYKADNKDVDYDTDVFPLVGDQAMGFGLNTALGHRFDSRKGPFEVLIKYNYSTSPADDKSVDFTTSAGSFTANVEGSLDQHDLLLAFRLPATLMPLPVLNSKYLYYDLGMGVSTLSYDYELKSLGVTLAEGTTTRSGLAFNLGVGARIPLSETWTFKAGADVVLSKIQDIEDNTGAVIHYAPKAHGMRLQVGLVHYFESLF
ncbi:MAG: outer membrane beta-barrel protein [Candidatus Delongbacteria bacterium]